MVDELSEYLQLQEPGSRGFGRRNLYNMVTFYDKYSTPEFSEIAKSLSNSLFVQRKTQSEFVQMPSAQMAEYQRKLIPRDILVKSLHDYCRFLDQEISNNMIDKE